jgi:hypothetical protein
MTAEEGKLLKNLPVPVEGERGLEGFFEIVCGKVMDK